MFKKVRKIIYKVLTAIRCPIEALYSFTNAHYATPCTFSQQFKNTGLQKFSKTSKRKSKFHWKLQKLRVEAIKNMSDPLKTCFLLIRHHITFNQVYH